MQEITQVHQAPELGKAITSVSPWQEAITPDALRGRMTSINQIFFMGGPQLGEIEAGAVAQYIAVPFAIVSGSVRAILGAWLVASWWPALARYNGV